MAEKKYEYEPKIEAKLDKLVQVLSSNDVVRSYQEIEARVDQHEGLNALVEEIKQHQKEAVEYAHYDKPVAEQEAIHLANAKQQEFDEHPLVEEYREKLIEANDLLQHITNLLESDVNNQLEELVKERLKRE